MSEGFAEEFSHFHREQQQVEEKVAALLHRLHTNAGVYETRQSSIRSSRRAPRAPPMPRENQYKEAPLPDVSASDGDSDAFEARRGEQRVLPARRIQKTRNKERKHPREHRSDDSPPIFVPRADPDASMSDFLLSSSPHALPESKCTPREALV
mmetsp:Transcript_41691/g.118326  ORF Transcript_41691/g.118326 Transcript_41691/m.118326 type:complete len:153 (-) Transcript_41691:11-469(-)